MTPIVYKYDNPDDFLQDTIDAVESFIAYQLESKEVVKLALSGGDSPKRTYYELSTSEVIDWNRIDLFQVDERYVPANNRESNYSMIERQLLSHTPNLRAFHSFNTELSAEEAAEDYEKLLKSFDSPLFDLVILGLGEDGHTASLFPGIPELDENKKLVVHTIAKGQKIQDRLSLTFPAILDSERIIFLIRGKNKEAVVKKWLEDDVSVEEIPAKKILEHPHVEIYFDASE